MCKKGFIGKRMMGENVLHEYGRCMDKRAFEKIRGSGKEQMCKWAEDYSISWEGGDR